jgi:PAS domain S-box-containing protein
LLGQKNDSQDVEIKLLFLGLAASDMKTLLMRLGSIADLPGDDEETLLRHRILIYAGILMCAGGLLWGTISLLFGLYWESAVPFGYVVITAVSFCFLNIFKNFGIARTVQISASLLLPFVFQWVLGGFVSSGGMMLWSIAALIGSLAIDDKRSVWIWLGLYVALTILSGFLEPYLIAPKPIQTEFLRTLFYVVNVVSVTSLVLLLTVYFTRARERALRERKRAEEELARHREHLEELVEEQTAKLREGEERFKDFAESASDWFWEMGPDLAFTYGSDRFYEITGWQREEIYGHGREFLLHPKLEDLENEKWRDHFSILERHEPFSNFEYATRTKVGAPLHISLNGTPVFGDDGIFLGYRGTGRDVSDRKQAEAAMIAAKEAAELADRAKSEFLANMSHELRTPLNAIMGFSEMMKQQALGPHSNPRYGEYSADIFNSGDHLLSLINDILDLSKIEAGQTKLDERDLDIDEVLDFSLTLVRGRAAEKNHVLQIDAPVDNVRLRADERMLRQMLINLLSNAVKFTEWGGEIMMTSEIAEDGCLRISVTDTGMGIAPHDILKAMSTFGQIEGALDRRFEGTGLGLPLVKSLAELHDGGLEIESEIGVGTKATIWFPRERVVSDVLRASSSLSPLG